MSSQNEITIPDDMWAGRGVEEGVVVNWFKREGSPVRQGEVVAEVMIEKVTLEIQSPVEGRIGRIFVPENGVVTPGQPLAEVVPAARPEAPAAAAAPQPSAAPPPQEAFVLASPAAKRVARELGVDLRLVKPTGAGGRVTEEDVRRYHEAATRIAEYDELPLAGVRKITAQRMMASLQGSAQLTLFSEADVTALVRFKEERGPSAGLTYTDLVARAVVLTLPHHPRLNAHLIEGTIRQHRAIHLGIAVALDEGLIVPVVRNAERLSLLELSAEIKRLAQAARSGALKPAEATGSTFSLTNLGMYGTDFFTPILNPPEVAILGVGRIREWPALVDGQLQARRVLALSLTIDHQAVDGATGAEFMRDLASRLAEPAALYD